MVMSKILPTVVLACVFLSQVSRSTAPKSSSANGDEPAQRQRSSRPGDSEPMPSRFRLRTYEVHVKADKLTGFQLEAIKTAMDQKKSLDAALAEFGGARLISMLDQELDLCSPAAISVGSNHPLPSGSSTFNGTKTTQVHYQKCGCAVDIRGAWDRRDTRLGRFELSVQMSNVTDSALQLDNNTPAPLLQESKHEFTIAPVSGEPNLILWLDGSASAKGMITHVYEITLWHIDNADATKN